MDKLKALLQKLGIELTADQTRQIGEVVEKEFVPAADTIQDSDYCFAVHSWKYSLQQRTANSFCAMTGGCRIPAGRAV